MKDRLYIFHNTNNGSVTPTDYAFISVLKRVILCFVIFISSVHVFYSAGFSKDTLAVAGNTQNLDKGFVYIKEGTFVKNLDQITFDKESSGKAKKSLTQSKKKLIAAKYQSSKENKSQETNTVHKNPVPIYYLVIPPSHLFTLSGTKRPTAISAQNENNIKKAVYVVFLFIIVFNIIKYRKRNRVNLNEYIYNLFTDTDTIRPPPFFNIMICTTR